MKFQIALIVVALIVLIIALTFIGYTLYNNRNNKQFPPVIGECPDYWISKDGECSNPHNLGKCPDNVNFNTTHYKGHEGNCMKSKWAKGCNVSWQGITNNSSVCNLTAK